MTVPYENIIATARLKYGLHWLTVSVQFENNNNINFRLSLMCEEKDEMVHMHDIKSSLTEAIAEAVRRCDFDNGRTRIEYRPVVAIQDLREVDVEPEDHILADGTVAEGGLS